MSELLPDLIQCADEPIRVPGAIQPHGRMVVLDAGHGRILAVSENWEGLDGAQEALRPLQLELSGLTPGEAPAPVGRVEIGGLAFEATAHRNGGVVIVEFELAVADRGAQAPIYGLVRHLLPQLQRAETTLQLAQLVAREMKRLTGFGRSLVYRFDAQGHGEVLAEDIDPGYDSYEHHHFPASDIPAQARELYRLNHIRVIPDANYRPVALRGVDASFNAAGLDLTYAGLRSVSPIHLEYMRNMGTLASMSVSVVVRGQLWGLVSCHDHDPRTLPFQTRVACEHLGRLLALQVEAKEDNAEVAAGLELRRLTLRIVSNLAESDATLRRLVDEPAPLLRLARASGAAVMLNDQCWTVGETPDAAQLQALAGWLAARGGEIYHSDQLAADYPPAADFGPIAAGLLAISISQVHRHLILWFRPEIVRTIQWAGDPRKEVRSDDGRIHPRRSFASWKQQVGGRCAPWEASETAAVMELRQALIGIVLRRAEEMAEVATELGRVNKELEAFSYTVSHDLRAPMRHIAGYVDLVLDADGAALSERARRYLGHVKEASAFAGHLVDALLDFSRMGRSALKRRWVDTGELVQELVAELSRQEPERRVEWQVANPLPRLWADPFLIQITVRNLLGNALKYTRKAGQARIEVNAVSNAQGDGLEVVDNGVGFQMKYVNKLFGVFQRLHQAEDFEGTGIGLASVRRIVERHGGTAWAHGELNQGARFGFTLPRPSGDAPAPDNEEVS